jgi:hypothetical protein
VDWFTGYLYLCYTFEASLAGSSRLSLILVSARMAFPFWDVEVTGTFSNNRIVTWPILTNNELRVDLVATYFVYTVSFLHNKQVRIPSRTHDLFTACI